MAMLDRWCVEGKIMLRSQGAYFHDAIAAGLALRVDFEKESNCFDFSLSDGEKRKRMI